MTRSLSPRARGTSSFPPGWKQKPGAELPYRDPVALAEATGKIRRLPPLVTSWEVERLKGLLADAQAGHRFLLQAGDSTETTDDRRPSLIADQLKVLLQMSLVLAHGLQAPIIRVGRIAGQYATPFVGQGMERHGDVSLPVYFGDNVNRADFDVVARTPDPQLLVRGHSHAALTLNFVRGLLDGGFADAHHTEYWELRQSATSSELHREYRQMAKTLRNGLRFMSAVGERAVSELTRVDLYTSHEAFHLAYEEAQTFTVPRRAGYYALSAHFPWIADHARSLSGAHVDYFRNVENPIAVKCGADIEPEELVELARTLNPSDQPGRLTLITRLGHKEVETKLPRMIEAIARANRRVLWVTDPMEGNTTIDAEGRQRRRFAHILSEVAASFDVHQACGSRLGGLHVELTSDDVTECTERSDDVSDVLPGRSARLNHQQALETTFCLATRLEQFRRESLPPSAP